LKIFFLVVLPLIEIFSVALRSGFLLYDHVILEKKEKKSSDPFFEELAFFSLSFFLKKFAFGEKKKADSKRRNKLKTEDFC